MQSLETPRAVAQPHGQLNQQGWRVKPFTGKRPVRSRTARALQIRSSVSRQQLQVADHSSFRLSLCSPLLLTRTGILSSLHLTVKFFTLSGTCARYAQHNACLARPHVPTIISPILVNSEHLLKWPSCCLQTFPSDYATALRQAQTATLSALKDGHKLIEVEFPASSLEGVSGKPYIKQHTCNRVAYDLVHVA